MMHALELLVTETSNILWGLPLVGSIAAASIIMTVMFNGVQIRYFFQSWKLVFSSEQSLQQKNYISPMQAFLNTLSASLGNGSAAGMATAICSGGPGAAFWVFVIGFYGIALRFAEVYASCLYMDANDQGTLRGGPMAYLRRVPGSTWLPTLYAWFCLFTAFIAGSAMQCNSMSIGINRLTGISHSMIAAFFFMVVLYVCWGGSQRIIKFSAWVIPVKVVLFFTAIIALLIFYAPNLYSAVGIIMQHAFTWQAVGGGAMGYTMQTALRYGISRSVSATELGLGTAGVLFGSTGGKEPFKTSIMSMASLMLSNHLVCCTLLLLFVASGLWDSGLTSTALTSALFESLFGASGTVMVTFLSLSFGLGVLVAYAYIGRECWNFLTGNRWPWLYATLYSLMTIVGTLGKVDLVWSAVDLVNGGMLIMSVYGLLMLLPQLRKKFERDDHAYAGRVFHGPAELSGVYAVAAHTNHIQPGGVFVAIPGTQRDGTEFCETAVREKHARKIVVARDAQIPADLEQLAQVERVDNPRKALAELSAQAYHYPAKKLKIIAVTGTKGKTTTTYLIEHILKTAGYRTARLSTVGNAIGAREYPTQLTTQQPDYLHMFFNECVESEVEYVVLEVAAQALSLYRVHGIEFDAVVFTNFSQEHAEFYTSMDEYFAAKASIIKQLKPTGLLVLNGEQPLVASLQTVCQKTVLCSLKDFDLMELSTHGLRLLYKGVLFENIPLFGEFNVLNCLMALQVVKSCAQVDLETAARALATFPGVPGRLNCYRIKNQVTAYIDYAHNPSSMQAVLSTLRDYTQHMVVVFGAGGNRDALKRPAMGSIAVKFADVVIITSDNPRNEDPQAIVADILSGISPEDMSKVVIEYDREQAIKIAYNRCAPHSTLVLLGKGPDEYQLVQGVKHPFSERTILESLI